ncbi:hypothetical protein LXL04_024090 [Taraxacum kok-saghyz]
MIAVAVASPEGANLATTTAVGASLPHAGERGSLEDGLSNSWGRPEGTEEEAAAVLGFDGWYKSRTTCSILAQSVALLPHQVDFTVDFTYHGCFLRHKVALTSPTVPTSERFRDRLSGSKRKSKEMAIQAGHEIREINDSFRILRNFAPRPIHSDVWNRLINYWDTLGWKKISLVAKRNRNSGEDGVTPARHTGASIGVAETRKKLKKKMGKEPRWQDVFFQIRLTPKSKEKYFRGDLEGLRYITATAGHAHVAYKKALEEKYGDDPTQQSDDPELWETTQLQMQGGKGKGRIYGIGSSDLHFAVTGTYSFGSTSSSAKGSQAEVLRLRQQVEDLKNSQTQMQEKFDWKLKEKESEMDARMQIRQYETDVRQSRVEQQLQEFSAFVNLLKQSVINLPNDL